MDQSLSSDILMLLSIFFAALSLFWKDIHNMRLFLIIASAIFFLYGLMLDSAIIIAASLIFIGINGYFYIKNSKFLKKSRIPGKLVDIFEMYRTHITADEFIRIMEQAENKTFMKQNLIEQGDRVQKLMLIVTGHVRILREGTEISTLGPGDFLGEISILTGKASQASVETKGIVEVSMWSRTVVQNENKLRQLISLNLIEKLIHSSEHDS